MIVCLVDHSNTHDVCVCVCQALRSRDSLQLEFTDCLLDKNRLRKRIAELESSLEQLQRETERNQEKREQSATCLNCVCLLHLSLSLHECTLHLVLTVFVCVCVCVQSHVSLFSEDQCFGPCCSGDLSPSLHTRGAHWKVRNTTCTHNS